MAYKQVVIRRSLLGNALLILTFFIFTAIGIFMVQAGEKFIGIASIVLFGGGGLLYILLMLWEPIAVISSKGITVPHCRGESFVAWENVDRFEVLEQSIIGWSKQKYIGIFVTDTECLTGTGRFSQKITKIATGWGEMPGLLINLSFSFIKIEKVMGILQEFYDEYMRSISP